MKEVPSWGAKNIWSHRNKCIRHDDPDHGICASLRFVLRHEGNLLVWRWNSDLL